MRFRGPKALSDNFGTFEGEDWLPNDPNQKQSVTSLTAHSLATNSKSFAPVAGAGNISDELLGHAPMCLGDLVKVEDFTDLNMERTGSDLPNQIL
jgi:hypothetical protein